MKFIETFREGENISEIYLCKNKQTLKTNAGKSYYSLTLQDKTGTVDAKVWDLSGGIEHFEALDFIKVDGQLTSFQGALQLNVRRIRRVQEMEYNTADYMPTSAYNLEDMYKELTGFIGTIKNPHLKTLIEAAVYGVSQQVKQIAKEQGIEVEVKANKPTLSSF